MKKNKQKRKYPELIWRKHCYLRTDWIEWVNICLTTTHHGGNNENCDIFVFMKIEIEIVLQNDVVIMTPRGAYSLAVRK